MWVHNTNVCRHIKDVVKHNHWPSPGHSLESVGGSQLVQVVHSSFVFVIVQDDYGLFVTS